MAGRFRESDTQRQVDNAMRSERGCDMMHALNGLSPGKQLDILRNSQNRGDTGSYKLPNVDIAFNNNNLSVRSENSGTSLMERSFDGKGKVASELCNNGSGAGGSNEGGKPIQGDNMSPGSKDKTGSEIYKNPNDSNIPVGKTGDAAAPGGIKLGDADAAAPGGIKLGDAALTPHAGQHPGEKPVQPAQRTEIQTQSAEGKRHDDGK